METLNHLEILFIFIKNFIIGHKELCKVLHQKINETISENKESIINKRNKTREDFYTATFSINRKSLK